MKNFSRRELLGRLAAGSALAMIQSLGYAASRWPGQSAASPFQRLNILFHGLTVMEFTDDEVRVYLPMAASENAYIAGTWLQEVPLARGREYRLSGVITGPRPELWMIDPSHNAVFHDRAIDPSLSFCKLAFPFPDFLTPLRLLHKEHGRNFFAGRPEPLLESSSIPQVVAFSYTHPDLTQPLEFRPLAWTPVIMGGIVNLHIWDAPVKAPSVLDAANSFARMSKMIGTPDLELDPVYAKIKSPRPDEKPAVPGLRCQEEWTLIERMSEPQSCGKDRKYNPKEDSPFDCLSLILF